MLKKYKKQKYNAKQRGIAFDLTYEQWLEIWGEKLEKMGVKAGQLGMLRTRDEGGYSLGNVRIGTPRENMQEAAVARKVKRSQIPKEKDSKYTEPVRTSWIEGRNKVFLEYSEDDEEIC